MFEQQLDFAERLLTSGNLPASEIVCRDILDAEPRHAAALTLLGVIAAKAGAFDHAKRHLTAALQVEPHNAAVRTHLNRVNDLRSPQPNAASTDRYLLIKSWGYGFWSDVSQVLGSLLLAEATGRIPVTHWGSNSLFGDGSTRDAFRLYFRPVSNLGLDDLARIPNATFFPPKWTSANLASENVAKWQGPGSRAAAMYFLNRQETIAVNDFHIAVVSIAPWLPASHPMHGQPVATIYRYLIRKYLQPVEAAQAACEAFFRSHLDGAPFVAVHMRGSDKILEDSNLQATQQASLAAIDATSPDWRIFLLTDDEALRTQMLSRYGERIVSTPCQRTSTSTGVHYLPAVQPVQAGLEVMTDTYLAARANRFIGNGRSNVSAIIDLLTEWAPDNSILIGRSLLMERNIYLHLRQ